MAERYVCVRLCRLLFVSLVTSDNVQIQYDNVQPVNDSENCDWVLLYLSFGFDWVSLL